MSDSIKVAIKVRPLIKREKDENLSIQWITNENTIVATDSEFRKRSDGRFEFDHIFDTNANNNNVFNVVRPIVDAAVNGFNGTVFAYGQTSSGKTYTMMGTSEEPGIVPLAVEYMFDAITNIPGREFLLRVSYLEIYNEKVNDLLNKNQDKNSTDLKVHEDVNGQVFVKCKEEVTNSPENVLAIMNKGNKSRRIGETNMNERSSRSHTIFRITIESREAGAGSDGAIQVSQLNMVDLAGSERARLTGATGERFKEGRHINLSLSTLALVIKQLSESQDYVNFRNSKLTRLLQTSLGGNAMTVMICAVTPAALDETQCTLSFASRARNVKNDPKLNEVMSDGVLLKRYAKQIDKLHTELERMKQLTQTTDFQEMESKMQEKDRINQNLEERIRLLQTRIITAANRNTIASFKVKEKRRRTWCGTGGFNKLNTSLFPTCSHLSPIKEMSPIKSHIKHNSNTTLDSSFQIAFADFELELMNSEANHDEDLSSDEDPFVTYREKHRVKFIDDVIVKSPINYSDDNITFDKIEASTQTVSNNSPDTPKRTLRDRIRNLTEEYSELKEFTTLEKQLHYEDHLSELQEKRSQFEKQLENITSDKEAFEHIASELRKKLTAAELRHTLAEDQLNVQAAELERISDLEKKIAQLSAQKIEEQNVPDLYKQIAVLTAEKDGYEHVASELRKKLNEVEQRNIVLEDKLIQNVELEIPFIQTLSNNEIISFEKDGLQCKITDLQNKLTEAELNNNSMKDKLEEQQQMLQNLQEEKNILKHQLTQVQLMNDSMKNKLNTEELYIQKNCDLENQIKILAIEKNDFKVIISELEEKLKEVESNNSLKNKSNEYEANQYEINLEITNETLTSENKSEQIISELQENKLEDTDRINEQELQLQKSYDMEKEIECLTSKTKEFEFPNTISERDEQDSIKLCQQSLKSLEKELTENQSKDEINHLQSRINDLQSIIQDIQNENTYLKEQATKSISYNESDLGNGDSSKITDDLSITKMSLDEDSAKLSADLVSKNQELDEIKHIVQSLKADIENLQQTVYLLTTENSELANKLATEKECNEKSVIYYQQIIDELYERNSKIMDEKLELENNLTNLNEQLETLRSRMPEVNLNEEQIIQKYEKQISEFQARNVELLSHLTDQTKELEMLKESKSLLYEHDCIYKDKLTNLTEKHKHLIAENGDLSTNLMDKIEENEGLKQECDILKNKLELSLKNKESIGNNDVEQLRMENTVLKTELMELKTNLKTLTEENSKISSQLIETIEDLDNARKLNSGNNTMHLSTLFNSTLMNDALDKSSLDDDAETKIVNLQEEVNHLTNLNRKLSDLKLGTCTQCSHLNELNENRRMLKLEVKTLNRKLENLQRKFSSKSAKSDALILKAKEDLNVSSCNLSFNASFSEDMNVTCVEERLQSLNNELQILKEDHNKLSDLYKEKCNEVEELQNSTITDSSSTNDKNSSIKKSPSRTSLRLENIGKVMNDLQNDFKTIKENNESVKSDLTKFINEKERMLLDEINTLKTINEELLQKLSESELLHATTLARADILENEVQDMTKKLQEFTIRYKEIENAKLLLEVEVDSLKEDKLMKEQTANELRQSHSCLEQEINLIKKEREELNNDIILLEQEYNEKLDSLKAINDKLTSSKAALSQEFANYIKESENRLVELNEKINKYNSENDYLKQELIRLRDIENKFEKMRTEYQSQSQQDKTLVDDNKKLKNVLNDSSKNIIKEIKSLEPKVDIQKFVDKSVDELFQIFMQTILMKEKEVIKTMRENFDKEKQKLEDEKRQSVDSEKRTLLWVKELECEIEKLQKDLSEREIASEDLQKEIAHLGHLLEESNRDREVLREKNSLLETDLNNLQIEYNKYSKIDTANEEAIVIAQKREKQAQEMIKNKESEFQRQLKSEKEAYNKQIEDLTCTIESFKTKNMELTNSIEGLEVNQKQLKNIIDLKSNDLIKNNQINQKMQTELEQLTETYNDLHKELEEKELCIAEIKELLKTKCDELTEYKINLETIVPENKLLKQQINERKTIIEQYKVEIETLKMENKKAIDAIKDQLNFEELKSTELNKQIAELNNKHMALTEEMDALRDNYTTLKHKYATLEKRVRNSTSKAQAEEQMEELKDLNRSLRNNLDGASNRITELQAVKTDLMKQVITLSSQYDAACKDNQKLKETLSSSRHNDTYTTCEKYDNLLQEKNKIALELEATKVQLNQKNKDIENYLHEIKELKRKNTELDKELDELAAVICEHDADNARLQDKYFTCRAEADELQDKIKTLEKKTQINLLQTNTSSNKAEKSHDDECNCAILKNKIRELQLEIVSKNGKIATLELQIRSGSFPYQMKCKELQEHLSAYSNKNSELKAEMKRLQMAMIRTSAKECDVCKQRLINRRHQACQTMPEMLKFCGTSSGVIDDEIRITKLEKEKQIMRDVCRTRSKTIKELEKQVEEYEKLLNSKNS
ncbi:CENPE protein, partial [Acromyrmex heyeri]